MVKDQPHWEDYKNLAVPDLKIDATDEANLSKRVLDERETRRRLLTHSRMVGCEKEMLILFAKYDKIARNCTNDRERHDMAKMMCYDVWKLLGGGGELFVDGQLVAKDS